MLLLSVTISYYYRSFSIKGVKSAMRKTVKSITSKVIVIDVKFPIVRVICILLVNSVVYSTSLCFTHYEEKSLIDVRYLNLPL